MCVFFFPVEMDDELALLNMFQSSDDEAPELFEQQTSGAESHDFPVSLHQKRKGDNTTVEGLSATWNIKGDDHSVVASSTPIKWSNDMEVFYFEVTFVKLEGSNVSVGLIPLSSSSTDGRVGSSKKSVGLDTSGLLRTQGSEGVPYGRAVQQLDTIGCIIDARLRRVEFTINEKPLGYRVIPHLPFWGQHPAASSCGPAEVRFNFGEQPFRFDLAGHLAALQASCTIFCNIHEKPVRIRSCKTDTGGKEPPAALAVEAQSEEKDGCSVQNKRPQNERLMRAGQIAKGSLCGFWIEWDTGGFSLVAKENERYFDARGAVFQEGDRALAKGMTGAEEEVEVQEREGELLRVRTATGRMQWLAETELLSKSPLVVWQSRDPRSKAWTNYSTPHANRLEEAWQHHGSDVVALEFNGKPFTVDLNQLRQSNGKGGYRPVRRVGTKTRLVRRGDHVVRGPDWLHGDEDGGRTSVGLVLDASSSNKCTVRWPTGKRLQLRNGDGGKHDVVRATLSEEQLHVMVQDTVAGLQLLDAGNSQAHDLCTERVLCECQQSIAQLALYVRCLCDSGSETRLPLLVWRLAGPEVQESSAINVINVAQLFCVALYEGHERCREQVAVVGRASGPTMTRETAVEAVYETLVQGGSKEDAGKQLRVVGYTEEWVGWLLRTAEQRASSGSPSADVGLSEPGWILPAQYEEICLAINAAFAIDYTAELITALCACVATCTATSSLLCARALQLLAYILQWCPAEMISTVASTPTVQANLRPGVLSLLWSAAGSECRASQYSKLQICEALLSRAQEQDKAAVCQALKKHGAAHLAKDLATNGKLQSPARSQNDSPSVTDVTALAKTVQDLVEKHSEGDDSTASKAPHPPRMSLEKFGEALRSCSLTACEVAEAGILSPLRQELNTAEEQRRFVESLMCDPQNGEATAADAHGCATTASSSFPSISHAAVTPPPQDNRLQEAGQAEGTETRAAGGFEDEAVLSVDISGTEKAAADEGRQQEHEGGEETTDNVTKAKQQTKAAVFPRRSALAIFVDQLHAIVAQTERLPVFVHRNAEGNAESLQVVLNPSRISLEHSGGDTPVHTVCVQPIATAQALVKHVLRVALIGDPVYQEYCRQLVGCEIEENNGQTALVLGYNPDNGTHKLQRGDNSEVDMRMAVCDYCILTRALLPEDLVKPEEGPSAPDETKFEDIVEPLNYSVMLQCPDFLPPDLFVDTLEENMAQVQAAIIDRGGEHTRFKWAKAGWVGGKQEFEDTILGSLIEFQTAQLARGLSRSEAEETVMRFLEAMQGQFMAELSQDPGYDSGPGIDDWPMKGSRVYSVPDDDQNAVVKGIITALKDDGMADVIWQDGRSGTSKIEDLTRFEPKKASDLEIGCRARVEMDGASQFATVVHVLQANDDDQSSYDVVLDSGNYISNVQRETLLVEPERYQRDMHASALLDEDDIDEDDDFDEESLDERDAESGHAAGIPLQRTFSGLVPTGRQRGNSVVVHDVTQWRPAAAERAMESPAQDPALARPRLRVFFKSKWGDGAWTALPPQATLLQCLRLLSPSGSPPASDGQVGEMFFEYFIHVGDGPLPWEGGADCPGSSTDVPATDATETGDPVALHAMDLLNVIWTVCDAACEGPGATPLVTPSQRLTRKLRDQLKDPLAIAAGALPDWCCTLPRRYPCLFAFEARRQLVKCTAFGVSRAVDYLQQEADQEERHSSGSLRQLRVQVQVLLQQVTHLMACGRMHEATQLEQQVQHLEDQIARRTRHHIGVLRHDDVKNVSRVRLLRDAERVMEALAASRHELEIRFAGENAHGTGVTQGFYTQVAALLLHRDVNLGLAVEGSFTACVGSPTLTSEGPHDLRPGMSLAVSPGDTGNDCAGDVYVVKAVAETSLELDRPYGTPKLDGAGAGGRKRKKFWGRWKVQCPADDCAAPPSKGNGLSVRLATIPVPAVVGALRATPGAAQAELLTPEQTAAAVGVGGVVALRQCGADADMPLHKYEVVAMQGPSITFDRPPLMAEEGTADFEVVSHTQPLWIPDLQVVHGVLANPNGLFPAPAAVVSTAVLDRFRFLGRLMAKAFMDGYVVPLPLSPAFFALLRGDHLTAQHLLGPFSHMKDVQGSVVASLMNVLPELRRAEDDLEWPGVAGKSYSWTQGCTLEQFLDVGLDYADPITQTPLSDAASQTVSRHNLRQFLCDVETFWLGSGVRAQVSAFRSGFADVVSMDVLSAFTPAELTRLLCGDTLLDWDEALLDTIIQASGGFTDQCDTIRWLKEVLLEMDPAQRRQFLEFVTAVPHLLPHCCIRVTRWYGPSPVPTAQTCTNQLNLPQFHTKERLRENLFEAMAHDGGFHERQP